MISKAGSALVTGASSGLVTAKAFADDINKDALRTATDELTSAGYEAIGVPCDV
jgi:hypothetical protein